MEEGLTKSCPICRANSWSIDSITEARIDLIKHEKCDYCKIPIELLRIAALVSSFFMFWYLEYKLQED